MKRGNTEFIRRCRYERRGGCARTRFFLTAITKNMANGAIESRASSRNSRPWWKWFRLTKLISILRAPNACTGRRLRRRTNCFEPSRGRRRFPAPLPVRKIPGIGEVTEKALRALSIDTVGQLAAVPHESLERIFGQWGEALYRKARGGDS